MTAQRDDLPRFTELDAEYEILQELGRGGTAVVYLARERELDRKVAIKVIRATYVEDEEATARLVREARLVGVLQHPNIVMLYGTRRLGDGSLALLMQYVEGRTLKQEVGARGPLPFEQIHQVLDELASALAYAHRHRIVHRDLKPENIYLDNDTGIARLSDFGIARTFDGQSSLTLPGSAIGTPAYMSPEQIDGVPLDGRSDIYSLGLVGYEMVTGSAPWDGEGLFGIIYKQKHQMLPSLAQLRAEIPSGLSNAIERALQKDPRHRWADANAFRSALNGSVDEPGTSATAPAGARSTRLPPPRPVTERPTIRFQLVDVPGSDVGGQTAQVSQSTPALPAHVAVTPSVRSAAQVPGRRGRGRQIATVALAFLLLGAVVTVAMTLGQREDREPPAQGAVQGVMHDGVPPATAAELAAGAPAAVRIISGADQQGSAGDTLTMPLSLVVVDAAGRPVTGHPVEFVVRDGTGVVRPGAVTTDTSGTASTRWIPGAAGEHVVEATVAGLSDVYAFRAVVGERPPAALSAVTPTSIQGTAGEVVPLDVAVRDERDQPLAGVRVRFAVRSGGGRVSEASVVTTADGAASTRWTLGSGSEQQVAVSIEDAALEPVMFEADVEPTASLPVRPGIAVGGMHSCDLNGEGAVACWGGNEQGQLGDGTRTRRGAPTRIDAPEPFALLAAGVSHTCALGISGAAFCWGANAEGQLGTGRADNRTEPAAVRLDEPLTAIATGMSHSCGLDAEGRLYCWGSNDGGQLGDGTRTDRSTPVRAGGNRRFRAVALGWSHSCALAMDRTAYCWGRNKAGALGDGGTQDRAAPTPVRGGHEFVMITAGSAHTCGLRTDGTVLCWGSNSNGQLGNATTDDSGLPVAVLGSSPFRSITAGGVHTCALTIDGEGRCWGRNIYGQLGDGTTQDRARPTPVAGAHRFTALQASGAHTCGTTSGGGRLCWGFNLEGQLGDGTRMNQPAPVPVVRAW